jgi:hypothetical protein
MPKADVLPPAAAIDALVDQWFFDNFHGSPVARTTEAWNVAQEAKQDLEQRLAALLATASG